MVDERTGHELARVAGEAVSNAARHARPGRIAVQLRKSRRAVRLRVVDDGCGPPPPGAESTGFGLTSMRERVEGLGGTYAVRPVPGGGTEVVVEVPRL
jgi:signal transduction histidine kinase